MWLELEWLLELDSQKETENCHGQRMIVKVIFVAKFRLKNRNFALRLFSFKFKYFKISILFPLKSHQSFISKVRVTKWSHNLLAN